MLTPDLKVHVKKVILITSNSILVHMSSTKGDISGLCQIILKRDDETSQISKIKTGLCQTYMKAKGSWTLNYHSKGVCFFNFDCIEQKMVEIRVVESEQAIVTEKKFVIRGQEWFNPVRYENPLAHLSSDDSNSSSSDDENLAFDKLFTYSQSIGITSLKKLGNSNNFITQNEYLSAMKRKKGGVYRVSVVRKLPQTQKKWLSYIGDIRQIMHIKGDKYLIHSKIYDIKKNCIRAETHEFMQSTIPHFAPTPPINMALFQEYYSHQNLLNFDNLSHLCRINANPTAPQGVEWEQIESEQKSIQQAKKGGGVGAQRQAWQWAKCDKQMKHSGEEVKEVYVVGSGVYGAQISFMKGTKSGMMRFEYVY
ncbi:hypothetical protein FGO68_gene3302 [Halteria grandinella]|uniref:Uncharacterized protein n=1 Tax=Halteria grandinella TaxID=5974 RepID=A0A8J8T1W1_HALGN|nr:hypothetical protein FGO68_gene3302 [Halteria grandinella]